MKSLVIRKHNSLSDQRQFIFDNNFSLYSVNYFMNIHTYRLILGDTSKFWCFPINCMVTTQPPPYLKIIK